MAENAAVKFVDIPAQYQQFEKELIDGISQLIHRGAFVGGEPLEAFEKSLADFCGVRHAIGCSDGTMALTLSLIASGIKKGDGVIVPANSYIASANAVVHAGGTPLFVDCDPQSFLIDLDAAESVMKKGAASFIIPVHLYGNPCPMEQIMSLSAGYGVKIIEDNAQAIGARLGERRTGSFGVAAGVSFYPAKNLGAFGQGGAVLTNDPEIARCVRMYVEQGQSDRRYYHDVIGYNGRLDSIQARVLGILLSHVDAFNTARLSVADRYATRLDQDRIQSRTPGATPVYHLFEYRCLSTAGREKLVASLQAAGVQFGYHYPLPIHKQKAYAACNGMSMPVSERLADTLVSLPLHPGMSEDEVERVCDVIRGSESRS